MMSIPYTIYHLFIWKILSKVQMDNTQEGKKWLHVTEYKFYYDMKIK